MFRLSILRILLYHTCISVILVAPLLAESRCVKGCDLALASFFVSPGLNLTAISSLFGFDTLTEINSNIIPYNPGTTTDYVKSEVRMRIPFSCKCIDGEYLAHAFQYKVKSNDTYTSIAKKEYANLTSAEWLQSVNTYPPTVIPIGATINVTINCSCGNSSVSKKYGLFLTYPLRPRETLGSVANVINFTNPTLLQKYNPGVNFNSGSGIVYLPTNDSSGSFRPLKSSKGLSGGAIAGISISVLVLMSMAVYFLVVLHGRKRRHKDELKVHLEDEQELRERTPSSMGIELDRSVEYSYDELARGTNNFSMENKIGSGGFGDVFYAELRGEKTAIKKMDVQSAREFLAELKVLTRVYHVNLVRLIGFCIKGHLFLIYEFIQNGNLSEHLRRTSKNVYCVL